MTSQNLQPLPDSHGLLVCPRSADVDPPLSLFVSLAKEFIIQTIPFEFFSSSVFCIWKANARPLFQSNSKTFLISIQFGIIISKFHARGPVIPEWMTSHSLTYLRKSGSFFGSSKDKMNSSHDLVSYISSMGILFYYKNSAEKGHINMKMW